MFMDWCIHAGFQKTSTLVTLEILTSNIKCIRFTAQWLKTKGYRLKKIVVNMVCFSLHSYSVHAKDLHILWRYLKV